MWFYADSSLSITVTGFESVQQTLETLAFFISVMRDLNLWFKSYYETKKNWKYQTHEETGCLFLCSSLKVQVQSCFITTGKNI